MNTDRSKVYRCPRCHKVKDEYWLVDSVKCCDECHDKLFKDKMVDIVIRTVAGNCKVQCL